MTEPPRRAEPQSTRSRERAATELAVPIGSQVLDLLDIAYRARRPMLMEGPTGIGKSQIVAEFARARRIGFSVLDLSLLEPPDLIGLPVIDKGRTHYASPAELPTTGSGVLMLEELNRAELPVMQPALQLLSARRLHSYSLPPGWSCVAAINPENGDYQVNRLDLALRTRFMQVTVCARHDAWLSWAEKANVHHAILKVVQQYPDAFESTSPRSWTYASDILHHCNSGDLDNASLLRLALRGFLPTSWTFAVLEVLTNTPTDIAMDAGLMFGPQGPTAVAELVTSLQANKQIDAVAMLSSRIRYLVNEDAFAESVRGGQFTMAQLEELVASLPGDYAEQCLEAAAGSAACDTLLRALGHDPSELPTNYRDSTLRTDIKRWREDMKLHLVQLAVSCAVQYLDRKSGPIDANEVNQLACLVADAGVLGEGLRSSLRARGYGMDDEG